MKVRPLFMPLCSLGLGSAACASNAPGHGHAEHAHHAHADGMPHHFDDADRWAAVFDAPERDAWQHPDEVVARVAVRDDLRVVDIGAGTGYFAARFARHLPRGEVVAVDIEPTLVAHLTKRAHDQGLTNLVAHLGKPDDPALGPWSGKVDVVFTCDTYHHIGDRVAYFRRVADALAPGGRVVVVDFKPDSPRGPPPDHKIAPEVVDRELGEAGLALVEAWDGLPDQYLRIYTRAR
jgi:SAM-dependent methyltransferase